ncbi:CvfB family protein [Lacticaseibacillus zhaodongensis]|uniref:CvfB family protein n=1 Tax=Lacticaseibacillus zhaodongensis TaxID=2668065 RepID=UPI0012D2FB4F|nr:S1-like domain-containing RNA-binding protein [Lacticaseibacillus zhaodongensis]
MDFNGQIVEAVVSDHNDDEVFLQHAGETMGSSAEEYAEVPANGTTVRGFAYENEHHQARFTTKMPNISESEYSFCEVVQVRKDLGVFVDVGLPDKDIVVSLDELPAETYLWPARGDRLLVRLLIDKKNRLWASLAGAEIFQQLAHRAKPDMQNKDIEATAYLLKKVGTFVFTSDKYIGFIHPNERDAEPRLGQQLKARVIGVREDGQLNLSLRPRAYEAIDDDAAMLMAMLQHSHDGRMWLSDKSSPEDIKAQLDISKGAFKRAVGHLLKAKLIVETDGHLELVNKQGDADAKE